MSDKNIQFREENGVWIPVGSEFKLIDPPEMPEGFSDVMSEYQKACATVLEERLFGKTIDLNEDEFEIL